MTDPLLYRDTGEILGRGEILYCTATLGRYWGEDRPSTVPGHWGNTGERRDPPLYRDTGEILGRGHVHTGEVLGRGQTCTLPGHCLLLN